MRRNRAERREWGEGEGEGISPGPPTRPRPRRSDPATAGAPDRRFRDAARRGDTSRSPPSMPHPPHLVRPAWLGEPCERSGGASRPNGDPRPRRGVARKPCRPGPARGGGAPRGARRAGGWAPGSSAPGDSRPRRRAGGRARQSTEPRRRIAADPIVCDHYAHDGAASAPPKRRPGSRGRRGGTRRQAGEARTANRQAGWRARATGRRRGRAAAARRTQRWPRGRIGRTTGSRHAPLAMAEAEMGSRSTAPSADEATRAQSATTSRARAMLPRVGATDAKRQKANCVFDHENGRKTRPVVGRPGRQVYLCR